MNSSIQQKCFVLFFVVVACCGESAQAQQDVLPDIPRGDVAIRLRPIVTGMGAPDYAISPPGDLNRLFVVEQKGLLQVLQNGSLLPTPALDIQSRLTGSFNPTSANDERGFLGVAFHPDFNTPAAPASIHFTPIPRSPSRSAPRQPMSRPTTRRRVTNW